MCVDLYYLPRAIFVRKNMIGELLLGPLKLIQVKFVISTVLIK